jgi:hypothetical protein
MAGGALILAVLIQVIPVNRQNPPVLHEVSAPDSALAVLKRSCYDCHSNETDWPWYSRLAPISWLVSYDVNEGRGAMNLSEWDLYEPITQRDLMDLILEQIDEKKMPLWYYLRLHPKSKLTEADITVLRNWISADEDQTDGAELTETQ